MKADRCQTWGMRFFKNLAIVVISATVFIWPCTVASASASATSGSASVRVATSAAQSWLAGPYSSLPSCRDHQQVYRNWGLKVEDACFWGWQIVGGQVTEGYFFWYSRY